LAIVGCGAPAKPWIGVNTTVGQPTKANAAALDGAGLQREFHLVGQLKAAFVRDVAMNWGVLQPHADRPVDFAVSDAFVRTASKADAELLVVFRGIPGWASVGGEAGGIDLGLPPRQYAEAFTQFVSAFVERYDGDGKRDLPGTVKPVHAYQFMSEMEDIPTAEYAYWLKLFHDAVKSADAKAVVVLGGLRSPGVRAFNEAGDYPRYFERLLADSELAGPGYPYFDVAAFDNFPARYPGRLPFEDAVGYLRRTMTDHKLALPIWLTAFGDTGVGKTEASQADNLIKWTLMARVAGIERVYWYSLVDQAEPGPVALPNLGLVTLGPDGKVAPKPALDAFRKIVAETHARPSIVRRSEGLYLLSGKGEPRYVMWKAEGHEATSPLIPGWWAVEKATGPKVVRQGAEIQLDATPLFIERTTSTF
jgi:hypothetical protein